MEKDFLRGAKQASSSKYYRSETGRTLLEILAVVMFICILGITGSILYRKAMNTVRANYVMEQVMTRSVELANEERARTRNKKTFDIYRGEKPGLLYGYVFGDGSTSEKIIVEGVFSKEECNDLRKRLEHKQYKDLEDIEVDGKRLSENGCPEEKITAMAFIFKRDSNLSFVVTRRPTPTPSPMPTPTEEECSGDTPFKNGLNECVACLYNYQEKVDGQVMQREDGACTSGSQCCDRDGEDASWSCKKCTECVEDTDCEGNRMCDATNTCCPAEKPYWNGTECVACTGGQVWDSSETKCKCPSDKPKWNGTKCIGCVEDTDCEGNRMCDATNTCCPAEKPYWNGTQCIACTGGQVWDSTETKCKCPNDKPIWNGTQCVGCVEDTDCEGNRMCDATNTCCPAEKPYWNGTECVACTGGQVWDSSETKCKCPSDKPYWEMRTNLYRCVECESRYGGYHGCQTEEKPVCNRETMTCEACPDDKPYWNGIQCINCGVLGPWWDADNKICTCKANYNSGKEGSCGADRPICEIVEGVGKCVICRDHDSTKPYWNDITNTCTECLNNRGKEKGCPKNAPVCDMEGENATWTCGPCPEDKPWWGEAERMCKCKANYGSGKEASCPESMPVCDKNNRTCRAVNCPVGTHLGDINYLGTDALNDGKCVCTDWNAKTCGEGYYCDFSYDESKNAVGSTLQACYSNLMGVCKKIPNHTVVNVRVSPSKTNKLYMYEEMNWWSAASLCNTAHNGLITPSDMGINNTTLCGNMSSFVASQFTNTGGTSCRTCHLATPFCGDKDCVDGTQAGTKWQPTCVGASLNVEYCNMSCSCGTLKYRSIGGSWSPDYFDPSTASCDCVAELGKTELKYRYAWTSLSWKGTNGNSAYGLAVSADGVHRSRRGYKERAVCR